MTEEHIPRTAPDHGGAHGPGSRPAAVDDDGIVGRDRELILLAGLVDELAAGASRCLVMAGGPGAGKSVLLDVAARTARRAAIRVLSCRGSEDESELALAGLHQLLRPVMDFATGLPPRQRAALLGVFGLDDGTEPVSDPMLTALGTLTLLSDAAEQAPVLLVVDDAHWLDVGTLDVLAFVARRLDDERVSLVLAARDTAVPDRFGREARQLTLEPLDRAAAALLLDRQPAPPTGRARAHILEQAAGVPLALVELARAAGRDPATADDGTLPLTDRLEAIFAADLPELPPETRTLLLLAAAAESAELPVILSAAGPAASPDAWLPAERAGLVRIDDDHLRFRHPLIRSAVYQSAGYAERHAAHRALAAVLAADPDRRAWHHAAAASGVDEQAARGLDDSAGRAQRRGGYAAAATALERAARLTPDPDLRARRLVRAATMAMYAGHPRWVGEISARVATITDDPALLAEASLHAGWALAVTTQFGRSLGFLLPVAEEAVDTHPALALDALATAATPAYNSGAPEHRERILALVERIPPQEDEAGRLWVLAGCDPVGSRRRALDLLAAMIGSPTPTTAEGDPTDLPLARAVVVGAAAWALDETPDAVRLLAGALEHLRRSPTSGTNATVAQALALALYESGAWAECCAALDEAYRTAAEAGLENVVVGAPLLRATLLALRGETDAARSAVRQAVDGIDLPHCRSLRVRALCALGAAALADGDHTTAYDRFRACYTQDPEPVPLHYHASDYCLADLAAAAVRTGRTEDARTVLDAARRRLACGEMSPRLDAVVHRAAALLAEPADAERHFVMALADPVGERWPFERAQVRLDYAEWLRRRRRAVAARPLLGSALHVFERLGAHPWTERTRAELRAAGVTPGERPATARDALGELTAQQIQIARLAAAGHTNREIGERLFLSPRTVGFHLYRIFPKLGITSRGQLRDALGDLPE